MKFKFLHPKLRPGVSFNAEENFIFYKGNEFEMEFNSDKEKHKFSRLIELLAGGNDINALIVNAVNVGYTKGEALECIDNLDQCNLLTENTPKNSHFMNGLDLAFHLEDLYFNHWKPAMEETELARLLLDGTPHQDIITGWSFEYYNVTKMAHDAIIGLSTTTQGALKAQAVNFYNEEYRHDKLMLNSLKALGYDEQLINRSVPLPSTSCMINMLSTWGRHDPLSFMASLFIYEGETEDYKPYTDALRRHGMPDEFVKGQEVHNEINVSGGHGNETREFLQKVEYVSEQDRKRVEANLQRLIKIEHLLHKEIISYYSNPTIGIPRIIE